ncbi:MAG: hypothetical protein SXQ77_02765, partial [Halobacteria archaeon]|nr:hypothetical protein [Halobacteria archaeon]
MDMLLRFETRTVVVLVTLFLLGVATTAHAQDDLDLREANVVGVSFDVEDDVYNFDVTLYHDDDGESGYANWW